MATIKISYLLDENGRRASLASGGDGKQAQAVVVPLTPELLAIAQVNPDGAATYDLSYVGNTFCASYSTPVADVAAEAARVAQARADKLAKERAEQQERAAKEKAERLAAWRAAVSKTLTGSGTDDLEIDDNGNVTHNRGTRIAHTWYADDSGAPAEEIAEVLRQWPSVAEARAKRQAEIEAWKEAGQKKKAEAEAARIAERDAWIAAHGSERLRKGLAAGLIDKLRGAYRSERIAHDLGADWASWDEVEDDEDNERINPTEPELDALLEARKRWPDPVLEVDLRSVRNSGDDSDEASEWRPALMMRLPWERDKWAVKYLTE